MDNKKKNILLISGVILLILVISGLTYAWFTWSTTSSEETKIVTSFGSATVYYSAGSDITGVGLRPTATKEEGIKRNISVQSDTNVPLSFNLYLDVLTLPDDLKDVSFKYELYKEGTTTALASGNFSTATLVECTTNSTSHIVLLTDEAITTTKSNYTLYLWIDGNMSNPNEMQNKTFSFKLHADGSNATLATPVNLLEHITNLYADNVSETAISTYSGNVYYADSVQLMNDGLDSAGTAISDTASLLAGTSGNLRYYGAEGDALNNYIYFNCDTYPETNCEKWRIIGIVDGKIKIMRGEQIGTYSWDYTSTREYNNKWKDATLMTMLNDGYYYSEDNVSYYNNSTTPVTINFGNPGVGEVKGITEVTRTKNIIDTEATWYINGASTNTASPNQIYIIERTGSSTWPGAIALAYPSDYGYAADLRTCKQPFSSYNNSTCTSVNWMKNIITYNGANNGWLINPKSAAAYNAWFVLSGGNVSDSVVNNSYGVSPVLYLNTDVSITSEGDGSSSNPYRISV